MTTLRRVRNFSKSCGELSSRRAQNNLMWLLATELNDKQQKGQEVGRVVIRGTPARKFQRLKLNRRRIAEYDVTIKFYVIGGRKGEGKKTTKTSRRRKSGYVPKKKKK